MKRLILTIIVCFMVCLSIPINSFAGGVGGALGGIGSGIDPRTDSRYKENFELDATSSNNSQYIDDAVYGDIIFSYRQNVDVGGNIEVVELKCYFRFWYIPSEFNNPCVFWSVGDTGLGNLSVRFKSDGELMPFACGHATEKYDGTFDCGRVSFTNGRYSNYFSSSQQMGKIIYSDFPVFSNLTDCDYYCSTNQVRNALYDSSPKDYSSELYFKSFDVIPHTSNWGKYYYFDVKYELSEYAKKNIDKLNLNLESCYLFETDAVFSTSFSHKVAPWFSNSISLAGKPYGFSIYVTELGCYQYATETLGLSSNNFIGVDKAIEVIKCVTGLFEELSGIDIAYIDKAQLYFKFNLRFVGSDGVVVGKRNDFTYDFLTKQIDKYIYTPDTTTDSSGNTTFVKDDSGNITYTQEGDKVTSNDYYYNKVTETDEGDTTNVTNNYYYYDKDGKEQEISEDEYNNSSMTVMGGEGGSASAEGGSASAEANASIGDININIGSGSGEYIDISPQSYALYIDAMKSLLMELDTTGGLFLLMHDAYSVFPAPIWLIIGGGLAAAVWVSLVCIARR